MGGLVTLESEPTSNSACVLARRRQPSPALLSSFMARMKTATVFTRVRLARLATEKSVVTPVESAASMPA